MKELWIANVVRDLFLYDISREELANEMGVTHAYLNMLLAETRKPKNAEKKVREALDRIVDRL